MASKTIRIAHNAHTAKLFDADRTAKLEVHRLLSYRVEGAEHMAAFTTGNWDGTSSFFSHQQETFPAGFVRLVAQGLRKIGYEIQIVAKPRPAPLGPERPVVDEFGYTPRYDYQPAAVDAVVRHGNVTVQVATGGGKSRIARMAYLRIARPTLFLTTRGILAHQMKRAVEGMGEQVALLGDGEWGIPYNKPDGSSGRKLTRFVVGMTQTFTARLEVKTVDGELVALADRRRTAEIKALEKLKAKIAKVLQPAQVEERLTQELEKIRASYDEKADRADMAAKVARHEKLRLATIEILKRFELVIGEEAHESSGDGFYTIMGHCVNAHYRMALTATPFMKDDEAANMRLLACFGPVAVQISEEMLIERGILARPYFKRIKLSEAGKPKSLYRSTPWQRAYEVGIVENVQRNKLLCVEVLRAMRYGMNAMMLVQHKKHGEILKAMLEGAGARAEFIYGDNDQEERDRALRKLGDGSLDVLIGTNILDVGVDVPSVGMIALAGAGKAEVAQRQRIGRGLREKKRGPNCAFIVDVADEFNTHLKTHALQRFAIVDGTPGFRENVVEDFDFAHLGFERMKLAA
jgi:superfamily II DNA or RNA helicase